MSSSPTTMTGVTVAEANRATGWDAERTRSWLSNLADSEAPLVPVSTAIFEAASLRTGESVLDVGCGAGATTVEAARMVGPAGRVVGLDISPEMIDAARRRSDAVNIEWLVADAGENDLPTQAFDAIISRFGLMFFSDPEAAFRRLYTACRRSGRLVASVWAQRAEVPYLAVPYEILTSVLDKHGAHYTPVSGVDGPFSLGNPEQTAELFRRAGWTRIDCKLRSDPIYVGGPGTVQHAADALVRVSSLLTGQPKELIAEARNALTERLARWHDGTGVALSSGFLVITANRL
jgi:ubiquinone/menaquinone biosynthesis C-methylase UbiE